MATLKNDKEKENTVVTETTNSTETNVNSETGNTEVVTQNQATAEVKKEKNEENKTYIYMGEELTKDGFILKHKGFYTSEQLNKIKNGMSNYEEIEEKFIDLDEYSEDK